LHVKIKNNSVCGSMRLKSVKKQGQNVNGETRNKHETTGFRITHKNKRRATT